MYHDYDNEAGAFVFSDCLPRTWGGAGRFKARYMALKSALVVPGEA